MSAPMHTDNPPAFPCETNGDANGFQSGAMLWTYPGMTLRDWFAGRAMEGICAHSDTWGLNRERIAAEAYNLADTMLCARGGDTEILQLRAMVHSLSKENSHYCEILRDIAGNGDPDFPSYSQTVARSALKGRAFCHSAPTVDYWTVAVIAAWLREQDGYGEWREAADAIDKEFLEGPLDD